MRLLIPILVLASTAAAQQVEAPKTARLQGIVRSTTGEAVPRATLRLEGPGDDERPVQDVFSDDEGRFRFDQVPPGRDYFLSAKRPGFVDTRYGARSASAPGTPLTLERGAVINDIAIAMTPQGVITGRVTGASGDPLVGAGVMALQTVYERGERRLSVAERAATNDQGEYRIANLAPGTYYISVADRRLLNAASGRPPEGYAITYFPNAADVRGATPLRLAGGVELHGIDVRLRSQRVYTLRGKVLDAAGRPANGTLVAAVPVDQGISDVAVNGPNGGGLVPARSPDASFEFRGLTPGAYLLQTLPGAHINNTVTPPLVARLEVHITDQDLNGAVLAARAGAPVTGTVKMEGAGIRGLPPITVVLDEVTSLAMNSGHEAPVSAAGTFRIEGPGLARYYVDFTGLPDSLYVKSVRFSNQDATHAPLDLSSGGGGTLDIVLSPKAAGITGIVRDQQGQALGAIPVTLWSATPDEGAADRGIQSVSTDQNGAFQFTGLRPGEYLLAAWEDAEAGLLEYHPFLTLFNAAAATLKLAENAHAAIEAPLIPSEKIKAAESQLP